jgi:alkanesulfonate monooxygenase SsuD/methylene tetrahydromethanopterin reductase-like flavin-dependent oxidoreductase (luciferase family)
LAKELKTLDDICSGRLTVGVGAGGYGWDATVFGRDALSRSNRADRFREFVELLDLLLRNRQCSYDGRWYTAREARAIPDCVQQPRVPLAVAATGPLGMQVASRFGEIWVTTGEGDVQPGMDGATQADGVARQIRRLDRVCAEVGRDPATLARMVVTGPLIDPGLNSPEAFRDTIDRYEALGFSDVVVHWPRTEEPYAGSEHTFENIITSR